MKVTVICTLRVEGIHKWAGCPIEDVSFLKLPHRHIFHIKVWKKVGHLDRETEIITLKRRIRQHIGSEPVDFVNQSCEEIAVWLINNFDLDAAEVLEDGENGAYVEKSSE